MRVVPNGSGSELLFTLFQLSEVSDEEFNGDARNVEADMHRLKDYLER